MQRPTKKLVLIKEVIKDLTIEQMGSIKGGGDTDPDTENPPPPPPVPVE